MRALQESVVFIDQESFTVISEERPSIYYRVATESDFQRLVHVVSISTPSRKRNLTEFFYVWLFARKLSEAMVQTLSSSYFPV